MNIHITELATKYSTVNEKPKIQFFFLTLRIRENAREIPTIGSENIPIYKIFFLAK